jgi:hypothetical protein
MARIEKKSMSSPDETRTFDKGKIELIKIGDAILNNINSLTISPKQIFGYVQFEPPCSIIIGYSVF